MVIILFILLSLSSFFSGSETALVSLSKFKIKKLSQEKRFLAGFFENWLREPQHLLTTILVGNTLANILFTIFATITALNLFPSLNKTLVETGSWLTVSFLVLIFGEIVPKNFSRQYPEKVASLSSYLLIFFSGLFAPLSRSVNYLIKKFFPSLLPLSSLLTREEIKLLIRDISEEGIVDEETGKMLTKAVELCDLKVREIMTPWEKVEMLDISEEPGKIIDRLVESGRTRIPIFHKNEQNIIGYIYIRDLLSLWQTTEKIAIEKLIRPVYKIGAERKVSELLEEFKKGQIHFAIVTDVSSKPLGIVTWEDILEEIIGEILDEYDLRGKWFIQ